MSESNERSSDRVFVVSIQDTEIVFCSETKRIISRFKKSDPNPQPWPDNGTSTPEKKEGW